MATRTAQPDAATQPSPSQGRAPDPPGRTSTPACPGRTTRRGARVAIATLVALSLAVYAVPALLGHLVVPGDDLTQNLPLRELVGRDLAAGHLPIFDPFIWSGSPLLAGWNAGAAYPLTWLFAVLPSSTAWTVNLAAAAAVASVGCYAFLRAARLGVLASWAGGLVYAFGGGMAAQVPHLGLIVGMSWVPVALLALLRLTEDARRTVGSRLGWTGVLSASVGLVMLSGEPRAITDAAVVLVLYSVWRLGRCTGRWRRDRASSHAVPGAATLAWEAGSVVAGGALGIALGAVQLIPGLAAVATSQRAAVTATLFSAGSLPVRWLGLLGIPDLLGGSGSFGAPRFLASYSLTEVTAYVGVLPLVAAVALFGRIRWRHELPEWVIWELAAVVGIVLALGNHTPLWHALIRVPLLGGQRLQSRNLLITDLALAVLLAYWLDGRAPLRRAERLLGSIPALWIAGMVTVALAVGPGFYEWLGVSRRAASAAGALAPWLCVSLGLALGALGLVWAGRRMRPDARRAVLVAVAVADLVTFALTSVVAVDAGGGGAVVATPPASATPPAAFASSGGPVRPIGSLGLRGRFAVYDPGLLDAPQLTALGVPDTNAVMGTSSVQGYSAIVDGPYARATGTHKASGTGQDVFAPKAAVDGVFDQLSTTDVFTPPQYLIRRVVGTAPPPVPLLAARHATGERRMAGGHDATWTLGSVLPVVAAHLTAAAAGHLGAVRVGAVTAGGRVVWALVKAPRAGPGVVTGAPRTWLATWPVPVRATSLVAGARGRGVLEPPVVTIQGRGRYALDGALQTAMVAPHWAYAGHDGPFAVYRNRLAAAPLTLRALGGRGLGGASVRRLSGAALDPQSALVRSAHGVDVVRAVADIPGWHATWRPSVGGPTVELHLVRHGVVQAVRVPPGRGVLSWRYVAPGLVGGEIVSGAALLVVLLLLAWGWVPAAARRLRSRR